MKNTKMKQKIIAVVLMVFVLEGIFAKPVFAKTVNQVTKEDSVKQKESSEKKKESSEKKKDSSEKKKDSTEDENGSEKKKEEPVTYVSIVGDSISTLTGYCSDRYPMYYKGENTDVKRMEDTWWGRVIKGLNGKLLVNNSYLGSRVAGQYASTFNRRCNYLSRYRKEPDIIFFYGGTNDYLRNIPLGNYDGYGPTPKSIDTFREAYAYSLDRMLMKYPDAKIYCMTILECNFGNINISDLIYQKNLKVGLWEYNNAIKEICAAYGVSVIDINQCGINYNNLPTYMADYNPVTFRAVHPNKAGHGLIADYILKNLKEEDTKK